MLNQPFPRLLHLSPDAIVACAIVAAAMVLGGGGSSAPRSELLLELVVALGACTWLALRRAGDAKVPTAALVLAGVVILLPVLQLIPLPPALWRHLPGRAAEADALSLVNAGAAWMPWSISPTRTAASLLATIPAAFVLCIAATLDHRARRALLATIAVIGFVSLLLGALQLADGAERTWRFYVDNPGYLNGFQANRNAEADVLLIALAAFGCLLLPAGRQRAGRRVPMLLGIVGCLTLLLGCALTGSRAGILIACLVTLVLLLPWRASVRHLGRTRLLGAGALLLLVPLGLAWLSSRGGALGQVGSRFTWDRDVRLDLWRDTLPALRSVWPVGGGVGTFRPLFEASEPLSSVDPTLPVRAHNELLEFLLEGGVPALAILAAATIILGLALHRAYKVAQRQDRPTLLFVVTTFGIVGLHSLVDYPFRSMSLATVAAASSGLLFAIARDGVHAAGTSESRGGVRRGDENGSRLEGDRHRSRRDCDS